MRLSIVLTLLAASVALAACNSSSEPTQQEPGHSDSQSSAAAQQQDAVPTGRLPTDVEPLAYTLDFTMDPDKKGFSAHEVLAVKLKQPTDTIWLHGKDINVTEAALALANGKTVDIEYQQVNDDGVVRLTLKKPVSPQKARIEIDFRNPYSPGLMGAYTVEENGDNYVFTQFEAIAARRAFPSFDEPAFKTPFTYSFTVPKGDKVVANTPVESKTDTDNGMVKWQFMTTKPLPTYLVAWAIGPFDIVQGPSIAPNKLRDEPVPVYGVTIKGKGDQIQYAVQHAGEIISAEEKYYGIAYPYRKLSLIAVPDFAAGAMENPGAVTFRGILLLMDPETAPTRQKRAYWSVAAHEFGHMWTGDLVTVPWWNDIWLNEAFATWQAQKVMQDLHPDWDPKMDALNSQQRAMEADSLVSARAIRQPIKDTGDIKTAFDGITYAKGAAVIKMFENYVGADNFRQGMHNYLENNAYGSASVDEFLAAISEAADEDVGPAFKTFLNQPGLPMVEATLTTQNGKPAVHLVQSRYLPVGSSGDRQSGHWEIPVCMRYAVDGESTRQCVMLSDESADVALDSNSQPAWLMPNAHGEGYYQWSLGEDGYRQLEQARDQLSAVGQMSLANSVEGAFKAATIHTAQAVNTLAPLADSEHNPVAEEPMGLIRFAHEWMTHDNAKEGVEAFARKLYGSYGVASDFTKGGAPDDANQRQFESHVARFLADTGRDQTVRDAANKAAARLLGLNDSGKPDIHALASDFVPVALSVAVQDKGEPVFDALTQMFADASNPFVRGAALRGMASATDPKLADKVRSMTLDADVTKRNEVATILFQQFMQSETRDETWQWVKQHYDALHKRLPGNFGGRLPRVAAFFCSDAKADDVKQFFQDKLSSNPGSKRTLTQAVERAHLCAARRKAQSDSADKFFSQFGATGEQ